MSEHHYRKREAEVARFQEALAILDQRANEIEGLPPHIARDRLEAVKRDLADLKQQWREFLAR